MTAVAKVQVAHLGEVWVWRVDITDGENRWTLQPGGMPRRDRAEAVRAGERYLTSIEMAGEISDEVYGRQDPGYGWEDADQ